jgi:polysaccharide biosynthesis transport protein
MQNKDSAAPMEDIEDMGGAQAPSIDVVAILRAMLRRWKLVAAITLSVSIATYGVIKLIVPSRYKSTVEILVFDPQQQIDATVQKPISPFVDALSGDAIGTEISILKSKSVALRVVSELGLDTDPEFRSHGLRLGQVARRLGRVAKRLGIVDLAERLGIADLAERVGIAGSVRAFEDSEQTTITMEEKADKVDRAADELIKRLDISQDSYIISVSATARDPVKARRLASAIANDYLASQREARQQALDHVAVWLKGRMDSLQSHVSDTEASIEKLKVESGLHDTESDKVQEQQLHELNTQLMAARAEINETSVRLEQARHVIDTNGDVNSIPELGGSAMERAARPSNGDVESIPEGTASNTLKELQQRQRELNSRLADLQSRFGERNIQIISARADLATVNKQIYAEVGHVLAAMKNAHDIAVRREQTVEASLQSLTASFNSVTYIKLQQLRHAADADRKDYETYLGQYNNISEQREMQSASARIISPATLPTSPTSNRMKFYALGGGAGLGGGLLLAFLLEYFKPGIRTSAEIEQSFGLRVVGFIPLMSQRKTRGALYHQTLGRMVNEPFSHLSEAVHGMRVGLELSSARPKVILVTSAVPGEGKSTAAMLLAASSASSGRRTVLLDCDLRLRSTSEALRRKHQPGLSELLCGTAKLEDVIVEDPVTKINFIPAGSTRPNVADLLMSQEMLDLVAVLRSGFNYVILDSPPLVPVVDALALAAAADKILLIVEWNRTPRNSIYEAFRVLGLEVNRVAGIVLNKVDFDQLPGYSSYDYRKYFKNNA